MNNKKYYGLQTELALNNFPFSTTPTALELILAICQIKMAAAKANYLTGHLEKEISQAIIQACQETLEGKYANQFVTPWLQGGAGTSVNMNVNEVIANRATEILKRKKLTVHPNDHVNMSQSTNDVNPSALKIACLNLSQELLKSLDQLIESLEQKAREFKQVIKLARTHLQDAIPMTLGEEFQSYADIIKNDKLRIVQSLNYMSKLNLGGTVIGNRVNASLAYQKEVYIQLQQITHLQLNPATNLMSQTSSQTDFLNLSQVLVILCLDCSKIASDIRLLSSGPRGGLQEISLPKVQAGSSIMAGKVNPVLAESVNQLYFLVSGNNLSIEQAVHGAQLELGVMFPLIAEKLIVSVKLTTEVLTNFASKCITKIIANPDRCKELLENSTAYATFLVPVLGYDQVTKIVQECLEKQISIRDIILKKGLMTEAEFNKHIVIAATLENNKF